VYPTPFIHRHGPKTKSLASTPSTQPSILPSFRRLFVWESFWTGLLGVWVMRLVEHNSLTWLCIFYT